MSWNLSARPASPAPTSEMTRETPTRPHAATDLCPLPNAGTRRSPRPGKARPPPITELQLHQAVADLLNVVLLPPTVWVTFPAGWTAMRPGAAGRLKACGLKAGMPDILIFSKTFSKRHCIGIELKTGKNKISRAQMDMAETLDRAGVPVW